MRSGRRRRQPSSTTTRNNNRRINPLLIFLVIASITCILFNIYFHTHEYYYDHVISTTHDHALPIDETTTANTHHGVRRLPFDEFSDKRDEELTKRDEELESNETKEGRKRVYDEETPKPKEDETKKSVPPNPSHPNTKQHHHHHHTIANLSCSSHGGPPTTPDEMIYWSDIPADSHYQSPFYSSDNTTTTKYLTFEPDHGGWNNIRMAMETILVMAHAMGRTLVLPPSQTIYLLHKHTRNQTRVFGFEDFFPMDSLHREQRGLNIITMDEFLRQTNYGKFGNNITDWNDRNLKPLWKHLQSQSHVDVSSSWDPYECIAAFPSSSSSSDLSHLQRIMNDINVMPTKPTPLDYRNKPLPVNAPTAKRLLESLANRNKLCLYDKPLQSAPLLHFKVDDQSRMLTHFYAFAFFQDWKHDLWTKRFVRDHVRYKDEIMCAAARVVGAIRETSKKNGHGGDFDAFHVRRGDFQYKKTRIDAKTIYENSQQELEEGFTVYIATDERDLSFFEPLAKRYRLLFLKDFRHLLKGVNTNYYGMIEQLIASKSRMFVGTWFSTFSGYINRLRGYHADKEKMEGWEDGIVKSWYFVPMERKYEMRRYESVRYPIYMREFPTAWRNIDFDLEMEKEEEMGSREND